MHEKKHEAYLYHVTFNAMHNLIIDDPKRMHAHTFCVGIYVIEKQEDHSVFLNSEKMLNQYFERYKGIRLNEITPFMRLIPTLENMGEVFYQELKPLFAKNGMQILFLEIGDGPLSAYHIGEQIMIGTCMNAADEKRLDAYCQSVLQRYKKARGGQ